MLLINIIHQGHPTAIFGKITVPVNVGCILNLISNLKPSVSCGLDNISRRLLKLCSPYISDSICDIINHVLETGIFPDDWKKAKAVSYTHLTLPTKRIV